MSENPHSEQEPNSGPAAEPPISVREILKQNWILVRALIMFLLIMTVPLIIAWKFNLFLVANN